MPTDRWGKRLRVGTWVKRPWPWNLPGEVVAIDRGAVTVAFDPTSPRRFSLTRSFLRRSALQLETADPTDPNYPCPNPDLCGPENSPGEAKRAKTPTRKEAP